MHHISPYPGLTAFNEADSQLFFGREEFVECLLRTLRNHHLVAIVGPSGVGKTSVLRAGLIPALLRQSPPPCVTYMRPGVAPFQSLASAITDGASSELYDRESVKRKWHASPPDVLVVDQFEELYSISEQSEVKEFIHLLISNAETTRTRSVISVRSDFVSQMIGNGNLAQILSTATIFLGGLTKDQLRRAIEMPARISGISIESGLVERLVAEVGSEPVNLPAMQLVLNAMYRDTSDGRTLTHHDYARTGGVPGVIARQCEQYWEALPARERHATRSVLLMLVTQAHTRRVAPRTEFSPEELATINRLMKARLVVASADAAGKTFIEIAHETMIRSWTRLHDWIEEEKEFLGWRDRLSTFVSAWAESGHARRFLLSGDFLADAERWLATSSGAFSPLTAAYVAASREHEQLIAERTRAVKSQGSSQPNVFISYALEDEIAVLGLCERLRQSGIRVWIDKEQIQVGQEWDRAIQEALKTADFIVVCLSERSIKKRGYVNREIRQALDLHNEMPLGRRFLMPVRLDRCAVPDELAKYQYADLFRSNGVDDLVISILGDWQSRANANAV